MPADAFDAYSLAVQRALARLRAGEDGLELTPLGRLRLREALAAIEARVVRELAAFPRADAFLLAALEQLDALPAAIAEACMRGVDGAADGRWIPAWAERLLAVAQAKTDASGGGPGGPA